MYKKLFLFTALVLSCITANSQKIITGSVRDEDTKEPIIGANVLILKLAKEQ